MPKKKKTKSKSTARRKMTPAKKTARKKLSKGKAKTRKKAVVPKKATRAPRKKPRKRNETTAPAFPGERMKRRSGEQSGDLQGLSGVAGADSESIDELLEEGNAFEADAVKGVEDAGRNATREVRTHEVPEDDVPEEYLDRDS